MLRFQSVYFNLVCLDFNLFPFESSDVSNPPTSKLRTKTLELEI